MTKWRNVKQAIVDTKKINEALEELKIKGRLLKDASNDNLCDFDSFFDIAREDFQKKRRTVLDIKNVCEGNLGIPRKQMPQVIGSDINKEVSTDLLINFVKDYCENKTGIKSLQSIKNYIDQKKSEYEKLKDLHSKNYAVILMAFINFYLTSEESDVEKQDKIHGYLGKIETSIEDLVNKEFNVTKKIHDQVFDKLKPTQSEIESEKTYGIATYILVKSLLGELIDNSDLTSEELLTLLPALEAFNLTSSISYTNFKDKLKENINLFTKGLSVDKNGYIIDGHHRWSSCKLLQYILRNLEGYFPITVKVYIKNKTFEEYYSNVMSHDLVFSLNPKDELEVKRNFPMKGGKSKRRYKRSKRTKKRVKKSRRRVKKKY